VLHELPTFTAFPAVSDPLTEAWLERWQERREAGRWSSQAWLHKLENQREAARRRETFKKLEHGACNAALILFVILSAVVGTSGWLIH